MKYTIHRALALLKTTQKRIEKKLREAEFIYTVIGKATTVKGHDVWHLEAQIKADYDAITAYIDNYQKIKGAIVRFNAGVTPEIEGQLRRSHVESLGQDLTVAEVIEAQRILNLREQLLMVLKAQLVQAETQVQRHQNNIMADDKVNNYILSIAGQEKSKLSDSEVEKHLAQYHAARDMHLIDPLKLRELVEKLEKNIADAKVEIDAILSEVNALNTIEVDLTE